MEHHFGKRLDPHEKPEINGFRRKGLKQVYHKGGIVRPDGADQYPQTAFGDRADSEIKWISFRCHPFSLNPSVAKVEDAADASVSAS